ncbi:MAG: SGNH/GDSL hydrolase family protein [Bacteroidetes bacterium]|nr:SGNH/GDSL hydrolase family protein [Bacteroidota bacterium]
MRSLREYSFEIPQGITRIAVFGDSFTECVDVRNEEAWPYLIEKSCENYEVLNFGVRAYGTDQSLLRYRRDARIFNPKIVLIGFMIENIRRNVNRYRPFYEHNTGGLGVKPRFLTKGDSLVLLPNPITSSRKLQKTDGLAEAHQNHPIIYGHFTPKGNLLIKNILLSWMKQMRILTPESSIKD